MSETSKSHREAVQSILDEIEENDWIVVDYNPEIDDDPLQVDVTIERTNGNDVDAEIIAGTSKSQRDRVRNIKDVIEELEGEAPDGAPEEKVIAIAVDEHDMQPSHVRGEIESLKGKGEIYEPKTDHLRTT